MHKVLNTSEIIGEIFSYSSRHTNTVAARVCRMWFDHAIEFIWDKVELNNVMRILSPYNVYDGGFRQPLLPHSWHRFFLYSKYVRHLECFHINYAAFTDVVFWRPCVDIFSPRLTALHWKGKGRHVRCLAPLLTSTLKLVRISLDVIEEPDTLDALCKTIAVRSSSLRVFEITVRSSSPYLLATVSRSLSELFSVLLRLRSLAVAIQFMTPELLTTISHLPMLENLLLSSPSSDPNMQYMENFLSKGRLADEINEEFSPFQSLKHIWIDDRVDNQTFTIAKAFRQGIQFVGLVSLTFTPCFKTPDQIVPIMEPVHVACPNLELMYIRGENCPLARLPWQTIEVLLQCLHLHTLDIRNCTVDMELEDVVTLATNRSSWRAIQLPSTKLLSYEALVIFARNCPDLVELGLMLDSGVSIPDTKTFASGVWFSSLAILNVGFSAVNSEISIGIFLSNICGNPLKIKAIGKYVSAWKGVEILVNTVNTTARVRMLNKEITSPRL